MNTDASLPASDLGRYVGERIRDARRQRHLTQAELARRIGIRAGPMNVIEKGRHVPSGRMLHRLARELELPIDALFPPPPDRRFVCVKEAQTRSEEPEYYGYESPPVVPLLPPLDTVAGLKAQNVANELARVFLALEDLCGAMKAALVPLYIPFHATEPGIEQLVAQVRHHLGITNAVVFDYLELMENAGLRVLFSPLPGETASLAGYDRPNGNAFFFVRQGLTVERQLFRLVFEFGRVYWHTRALYGQGVRAGELDELHAARKFAALFLMPAAAVRATVGQLGIGPDGWSYPLLLRIKHRFGVSAESFCIRLEELGLIAPDAAQAFKQRIRAHYREHRNAEPDGSLRRLAPNGRLGDLLLNARARRAGDGELDALAARLKERGVVAGMEFEAAPGAEKT